MEKFKKYKIIIILLVAGILLSVGNYYMRSKFHSGDCVQALDGYTWHINNYSFGKYYVMGWQEKAWGNEVSISKDIFESKELSGIPRHHLVFCPEYSEKVY